MARRAFRGRGISQSQRRKKTWGAFIAPASNEGGESPAGILATTLNFDLSVGATLASPQQQAVGFFFGPGDIAGLAAESTLLRLRGSLNMTKNSVGTGVSNVTHAFGIAVVESTNVDTSPVKFPNPADPIGAQWDGWMFYRSINTSILDAEAAIIDVKSMRKIQSGYSLLLVAGTYSASTDDSPISAAAISTQLTARGLFLLP